MTTLTIITGDHKTGKTTRANEILNVHHATVVIDEVEQRIDLTALNLRDMVLVLNVPSDVTVVHEHREVRREPEYEWELTGWPGCNEFRPQDEASAYRMLNNAMLSMRRAAERHTQAGDHKLAEEMYRRVSNAGIRKRLVVEWEDVLS